MSALAVVSRRLWLDPAYPDRLCRGADLGDFMQGDGERTVAVVRRLRPVAVSYCRPCPVREACREAGRGERWGLWGGVVRLAGAGSSGPAEVDLLASSLSV